MVQEQSFSHSEGESGAFEARGLRSYFEYRDLGVADATNGAVVAHVIKAREGHSATGQWHVHDCSFQFYYVLKGWARFEYEGHGIRTVRPGDCVVQPAGIRHREIEHSEDFELIEVVSPANFGTRAEDEEVEATEA
ncbi:cupin domain-containing protein [Pseudovibrio brasiliensis]|uniref:Cupin domain-containing protein n=1 Tax=Pseudovibrio brasiliensis TaxID=1898042 RepID=A0ABX8APQ8_9HYPH|nr:cupin domain-containing protein [Pseudovibrio brasiliensis]QUS56715.1 cupin domain-containing protein [Pseudovibrio brasiliensis]